MNKLSKDHSIDDNVNILEESLRPKDSGTIYTHYIESILLANLKYSLYSESLDALEEVRGQDWKIKRHILKYKV